MIPNEDARMNSRINSMIKISVMVVLIIVCSFITIPFVIPFSMQTFAICFALLLLGGFKGTVAIGIYLLMGFVGIPCFSGFSSGPGHFWGPSGGFLFGFLLMGLLFWGFERLTKSIKGRVVVIGIGMVLCYMLGAAWFSIVTNGKLTREGIAAAFISAVLPFVIPDAVKIALAVYLCQKVKKITLNQAC